MKHPVFTNDFVVATKKRERLLDVEPGFRSYPVPISFRISSDSFFF